MKKISIVIPAKNIEDRYLSYAKSFIEKQGFECELMEYRKKSKNYFSSTIDLRVKAINEAINNNSDILWMARGGYGCSQTIDKIHWNQLASKFKWIIGFSDITFYHAYINNVLDLETIHGTMPLNFEENSAESLQSIFNIISGIPNQYEIDSHTKNQVGQADGKVVGGNLAILAAITGSKFQLKTKGKILFIEDVGEYLYKIDRMLYTLKWSGQLDNISGLIVGGFTNINDTDPEYGMSLEDIILSHISPEIPVCFDFPAGHLNDNRAIVFNREAVLNVDASKVTFTQG